MKRYPMSSLTFIGFPDFMAKISNGSQSRGPIVLAIALSQLKCSFAKQEAKLDRILDMITNVPPTVPQTSQYPPQALPQPPTFSTPFSVHSNTSSLEYLPTTVVSRPQEMEGLDSQSLRTALETERLVDNTNFTGKS